MTINKLEFEIMILREILQFSLNVLQKFSINQTRFCHFATFFCKHSIYRLTEILGQVQND